MFVQDAMVAEVATCTPQNTAQDIAMMMWDKDCGAVPVIDAEEHPVGIITDRDITMSAALQRRPLWEIRAEEITNNRELFCCQPSDRIQDALDLMEKHEVRRLPVVDQNNQLCGMLSLGDIVSFTQEAGVKAGAKNQIDIQDTLDFLKHVSAHHRTHRAAATV